jgi:malate synthase
VPIHNLMEDAATAEISRAQVWQWLRHGARLSDGRRVEAPLVRATLAEEVASIRRSLGASVDPGAVRRLDLAAKLIEEMATSAEMGDFLTLPAYEHILTIP